MEADDGITYHVGAKVVVSACGPSGNPNIPSFLSTHIPVGQSEGARAKPPLFGPGWQHSAALALPGQELPPKGLVNRQKGGEVASLVVLGGGLTSAQICDVAIRRGIRKVVLVVRSHLKGESQGFSRCQMSHAGNDNPLVKPFDVGREFYHVVSYVQAERFLNQSFLTSRMDGTLFQSAEGTF
jgi:hypothetical protein